jgi:transcriptional regulator with XRE-family HTH domain
LENQRSYTPNQVVAYNLKRARTLRGLTLDETALRLTKYVGETWTRANLSALERSQTGGRPRRFETHDLVIYALVFDLSPLWFLMPPPHASKIALQDAKGKVTETLDTGEYIDLLFFRGWVDVHDRLEELPPEQRGHAREQQAGVLDLYMREALQEQGTTADSLRDVATSLNDLADRLSPAAMTALNRLRRGYKEEK